MGVTPARPGTGRIACLAATALLFAACSALPGGGDGREAVEAYSRYRKALAARDRAALRQTLPGADAPRLEGADSDARLHGEARLLPSAVTVLSAEADGDVATLLLREGASILLREGSRTPPFPPVPASTGSFAEGKVRLVRQDGTWRVAEERWSREPASSAAAPAPFLKGGVLPAGPLSPAGHEGEVSGAAFASEGRIVTTGASDGSIRLWDGYTGALLAAEGDAGRIRSLAVTRDGRTAATADDGGKVSLRDVTPYGFGPATALPGSAGTRPQLAVDRGGALLAAASYDRRITVWSLAERRVVLSLETKDPMRSVAFSPAAPLLAAGSAGDALYLLDLASGKGRRIAVPGVREDSDLCGVAFSPDGGRLVSAHVDGTVLLWDVPSQSVSKRISLAGDPAWAVAFSPDGALFATANQGNAVRLWDGRTGGSLGTLSGHGRTPRLVAFHPDGSALAGAGAGGEVRVWR